MSIPPAVKFKYDELKRQRELLGEKECIGCDGYGVLMMRVDFSDHGLVNCFRCRGTGSEPESAKLAQ